MSNLTWPDGKRSAVMFSFDVDGDTTWENGNRGLPNGDKYIKSLSVDVYKRQGPGTVLLCIC